MMEAFDLPLAPSLDRGLQSQGARRLLVLLAIAHGAGAVPGLDAENFHAAHLDAQPLQATVMATLKATAEAKARALEVTVSDLLRFSDPQCHTVEISGGRGVMRRIDRIWGGPTLTKIEAQKQLVYTSPCHCPAQWVLVRGAAWLAGVKLEAQTSVHVGKAQELVMEPGAEVLIRRSPVPTLIEAAQAAGLSLGALITGVVENAQPVATPIGVLSLDTAQRSVRLAGRRVRLTPAETVALEILCQHAGLIVSRARLAAALGAQARTVDRVIVQLRDKLGDGLITTIYGTGYLLDLGETATAVTA